MKAYSKTMDSEQKYALSKHIQGISGFFFFFLGGLYFCLALILNNGYSSPYLLVLFNILDVPFAIVSLLYAGSSLKVSFYENNIDSCFWNFIMYALGLGLFAIVFYINFMMN